MRARMGAKFPQLGEIEFEHVWHGHVAMTEDRLPHLHELAPGLWAMLGYQGRGVALSVAMGPVLRDALKGAERASLALTPTPLKPIPAHALARQLWRGMLLLLYRWRDMRD
jgi:glycine/D-amino acid oxidase-like deaminating enzyme